MASKQPLIFKDAIKARDAIVASQKKEIAKLYENWADEIGEKAKFYSHKSTASSVVSERYMKELQKQLRATSQQISNEVYSKIKNNLYIVSDAVVADNIKWLESFGFSSEGLNAAFSYVPDEVIRNLITGQIYDSGWSLSARIWSDNEKTLKDIYQIMAKGVAENKPIYDIAKDLESYVRPSAKKSWNPILAMKNTKTGKIEYKRLYKKQVDYNAQRLARTLVQHGYQQSFIATTQKNPFITEYVWHSNGSRPCELCQDRDGMNFAKEDLPMDHPNGMCTMEPVVAENMVDQLADWFNSPDGTYPEIDEFAGNFGYQVTKTGTVQDFINKYGMSAKSPNAWFNSLSQIQKAEAKILKEQSGLTWNKWYEQNIYSGDGSNLGGKTIKVFNEAQEKYLKPYGFSPDNMPKNFDDWSYKLTHEQGAEILKSMGTSWGDPHPYQQLMKYFDANLSSSKFVTTTKKVKAASKVVTKTDDVIDTTAWYDSIHKNNLGTMETWTDDWLKVLVDSERDAVHTYTGSAYENMNEYLRGLRKTTYYEDEIKACQSALSKASLPRETIVRRGSGYNMLDELGFDRITPDSKSNFIGAIVQDKGFVSTSPDSSGGFSGSIEYVIRLPQGSQAMYIAPISRFRSEKELLINCGGKYIVEDIEFNGYGDVKKIYMTLINLQ